MATDRELEKLADRVIALSPADRLRVAAGLLEGSRPNLALTIAEQVVTELSAALLLAKVKP